MSEYSDEYDDENEGQQGDGPAGLRKAQKEAVARAKAAEKELADLRAQFAEISKKSRASDLASTLTAAGGAAAARVAKFYPADADVTEDAVKSWLDENKDTFNLGAPAAQQGEQEQSASQITPEVQAYLDATERANVLDQEQVDVPAEAARIAQIQQLGRNAKSMQELSEGMAELGVPVAPSGYRR
jgi:hypothetical protein